MRRRNQHRIAVLEDNQAKEEVVARSLVPAQIKHVLWCRSDQNVDAAHNHPPPKRVEASLILRLLEALVDRWSQLSWPVC